MGTNPEQHTHVAVVTHMIRQRLGIPYEIERTVCAGCARVLDEKSVKRLTAA
jgi:RNase P subunit RPR2